MRQGGSIPKQIGDSLKLLQFLRLQNNRQLQDSIPSQLGLLTNLRYLELWGNNLSNSIPPQLGNLTNLVTLSLEGNQLMGNLPTQLGNLKNLSSFSVNGNKLSGNIPVELSKLRQLSYLQLSNNRFTGSLPSQLGDSLTNLIDFYAFGDSLVGAIPKFKGNKISILDIQNNICLTVLQLTQLFPLFV